MSDSPTPNDSCLSQDEKQLNTLRDLLFGAEGQALISSLKPGARELVKDVISEALHERQRVDDSVVSVIQPIVEQSVANSVTRQSERLTTILYPLIGGMVRKSVAAFIGQFIEKTNTLLENAISIKGISMRFQAWKLGIPFSQYLLLQAYKYRVDTVLLIHRETGTLLSNVTSDSAVGDNPDLVSAMLTAINDFVSDSFNEHEYTQQLDEVKTDDISLYICHGPQALLVVASQGTIPSQNRQVFNQKLEQIHHLFGHELLSYNGDNEPFLATQPNLQACLITEKIESSKPKRPPWLGYIAVTLAVLAISWFVYLKIDVHLRVTQLATLNHEPGYIITSLEKQGLNSIGLSVLRDPVAVPLSTWFIDAGISSENIHTSERHYVSLDVQIVKKKVVELAKVYDIDIHQDANTMVFTGELDGATKRSFDNALSQIAGIDILHIDTSALQVVTPKLSAQQQQQINQQVFLDYVARISQTQINFDVNQIHLNAENEALLENVVTKMHKLLSIATTLNMQVKIIIIGTSDTLGSSFNNLDLSQQRAEQVKRLLVNKGVDVDSLHTTGLGEIDLTSGNFATRKVLFNVIYSST